MKARFEADGDVIVITGGANGIGRAVAVAAAKAGAKVVICDVDAAAMAATKAEHGSIDTEKVDVGDREAVIAAFTRIERPALSRARTRTRAWTPALAAA